MTPFAESIFKRTYAYSPSETWEECALRVAKAVAINPQQEKDFFTLINDRVLIPGGRYLYTSGRPIFTNSNCYGFLVEDTREGWSRLLHDVTMCLSTGGGLGVNYSNIRPKGTPIGRMGGEASGPLSLMQMVNEVARHVMAGGKRRSALWAGLHWQHPDLKDFISIKDWDEDFRAMKSKRFEFPAPLDMTNVSVIIDEEYLDLLKRGDLAVEALHTEICERMTRTGEPAFRNESRILDDDPGAYTGNACQESTLHDRDTCNLASIVMPRVKNLDELDRITRLAIEFLYNGSLKATYPTPEIASVAKRNRRLGLGVMGMHEWMIQEQGRYEWSDKAEVWFKNWSQVADEHGKKYARKMHEAPPVTTRAIAPTGTISIIAETTSGIEPMFCKSYKRRYLNGDKHLYQYVIDPTAKRLLDDGVKSETIEDAYSLNSDLGRRLTVQMNVQRFVDQAISNTVNLPPHGSEGNPGAEWFNQQTQPYLSSLKGLTVYPDGARSGQPLTPVPLEEAYGQDGVIFEEEGERCAGGVCGL